jgi:hypothetical protein
MHRYLPLICALLATGPAAQAANDETVYKWSDAEGEIHYSQVPPQNREYEVIRPSIPSSAGAQQSRKRLQEQVQAMDESQQERADKKLDAEEWARIQQLRRENCATARQNLAKLQQGGEKRYLTPDGQVIRLSEEERQRRIDETNKQIEENCD